MTTTSDIIDVKSTEEYFFHEKAGLKNNTVQSIDLNDNRYHILLLAWKTGEYPMIRVNCVDGVGCHATDLREDQLYSFLRQIQHIALIGNTMIITWVPS